ncbi:MAG TPA: beta-propeller fold lactonase family protein [Acidobacteriaceae bacterium]|nr:beta-propeller fold lactonase family protein [Acidobacteriaceae bacterium]
MKFWKYGRVALALIGSMVLGLSITCCGIYTSGYMYVTGAEYNQIGGYKIDHDFGYLTPITGSPFPSAGNDPVQELVLPGGRFLATVNKGSNTVSMYTIGGSGVLYFQASYATSGSKPVSLAMDSSGQFLYSLDQVAPDGSGRGDITVFQVDQNTGKLTLITNQNTFNTLGTQLPYFEVNYKPVQVVVAAGFLYVLDQAYTAGAPGNPAGCAATLSPACSTPDVFLYAINSTNGQLTLTQNQPLQLPTSAGSATTMTVAAGGKYLYIADTNGGGTASRILPFTIGPSGVLQILVGGPVPNNPTSVNPDALLATSNANFLYVANFGPASVNTTNSNIYALTIDAANGQLQPVSLQSQSVYTTGSGPIWIAEDSTNQYLYTANFNDNSITGKVIDATTGQLSNMFKGTQFSTVGQPTFLAVSGRVY